MTALDQAFINAYTQQGVVPMPAVLDSAEPVRLDDVIPEDAMCLGERDSAGPSANVEPVDSVAPEPDRSDSSREIGRKTLPISELGIEEAILPIAWDHDHDHPAADGCLPTPRLPEDPATSPGEFRPMLQVDRLGWPRLSDRLLDAVPLQIDCLADAIRRAASLGRRAIGFAGGAEGEGCTTLVATVARRLADQGVKVVLVDADGTQPSLPEQLGLLVEIGWEDVAQGKSELAETLIESGENALAVLPLRGTQTEIATTYRSPSPELFDKLRDHYDVVLVDLGRQPVEQHRQPESKTPVGSWPDAFVWVHSVRSTCTPVSGEPRGRLRKAGLCDLGMVENFVDRAAS